MDAKAIKEACDKAMKAAAERPGRYGGRYVSRWYDRQKNVDVYEVLEDDDPEKYRGRKWEKHDIFAQVTSAQVYPLGRARYWLDGQGRVVDEVTRVPKDPSMRDELDPDAKAAQDEQEIGERICADHGRLDCADCA